MAGAEAAAQEAALLVTAEGARFLDEIRDALADLQLRVVSEERVPLRRTEAEAAVQVLQSEAAAPAAADAAAAADGKGKAAKPKKGGKAAAAAPEPEAKSASPRDIDRSDLDALTAGEALVVTVGPALPLDGEDGGPSAAPEGREVWSEVHQLSGRAAGGLGHVVAEAIVAAAEADAAELPSVGAADAAMAAARSAAAMRHVFAAATAGALWASRRHCGALLCAPAATAIWPSLASAGRSARATTGSTRARCLRSRCRRISSTLAPQADSSRSASTARSTPMAGCAAARAGRGRCRTTSCPS